MDTIIDKYYKGFDGEPEIQFIRVFADGKRLVLSIWEGFFDKIMSSLEPEPTGWSGLAYTYHMHEGWYEESPWQIKDLNAVIDQLKKIDVHKLDPETQDVYNDILQLFISSHKANETIWINYF